MNHDEIDFRSETWRAIRAHAQKQLDELRLRNDAPSDAMTTAGTRGRIAVWKELLAMPEEAAKALERAALANEAGANGFDGY